MSGLAREREGPEGPSCLTAGSTVAWFEELVFLTGPVGLSSVKGGWIRPLPSGGVWS